MKEHALSRAIEAIDVFVSALSEPLRAEDRAADWTSGGQKAWLSYMNDLRARLLRGVGPGGAQYNLMRGLNFDGIGTGRLADHARRVQRRLAEAFPDRIGE